MDYMQEYEIRTIVDNIPFLDRNNWEQTRLSMYANAQMNTKKKLTVKDIVTFPWEKEVEQHNTEISTEDIKRLREKAKNMKIISNGTI
jgi:hypothetical protein